MAISPQTLKVTLGQLVDQAEQKMDAKLIGLTESSNISFDCHVFGIKNQEIYNELRKRYVAAGWKDLKWNCDQRDGDFVTLITP